jgi:hypothetical protein
MKKRKPSGAKKRTETQTKSRAPKGRTSVQRRPRPTVPVPVPTDDNDIFIPVIGSSPPVSLDDDDDSVFVPPGFQYEIPLHGGLPRGNIDAALDEAFNFSPRLSPGFDARGVCRYGCDGVVSVKDPVLGMHHYACPFWDSEEGIVVMRRLEKDTEVAESDDNLPF